VLSPEIEDRDDVEVDNWVKHKQTFHVHLHRYYTKSNAITNRIPYCPNYYKTSIMFHYWNKPFKVEVARWPHGYRRQCSEVAVPALVGSNPTEGGGFFRRKETPPGHGCVCMSSRGCGRKSDTLPTPSRGQQGSNPRPDGPPMDVCTVFHVVLSRKKKGEERVGVGGRGKYPGAPPQ
jgi:hypothetical protein